MLEVEASEASSVVQRFQAAGVPGACSLGETTDAGPQAKVCFCLFLCLFLLWVSYFFVCLFITSAKELLYGGVGW